MVEAGYYDRGDMRGEEFWEVGWVVMVMGKTPFGFRRILWERREGERVDDSGSGAVFAWGTKRRMVVIVPGRRKTSLDEVLTGRHDSVLKCKRVRILCDGESVEVLSCHAEPKKNKQLWD